MTYIDIYNSDISTFKKNEFIAQLKFLSQMLDRAEDLSVSEVLFLKENFKTIIGLMQ